jgi:hypothetical protein
MDGLQIVELPLEFFQTLSGEDDLFFVQVQTLSK